MIGIGVIFIACNEPKNKHLNQREYQPVRSQSVYVDSVNNAVLIDDDTIYKCKCK